MGFLGLLKFALLCIDFLAWPVIALGYPLFSSIRAIESGSKYHTRKLVIYWTLFSLISLFEFAFVKIIEWIPFWYSIKLIAIFWLAIPRFHGACYAYQSFVRPHLVVNLQEAINRFEEQHRMEQTFLDHVADKYIKEKNAASTSKQLKEAVGAAWKDYEMLEAPEKSAVPEAKQLPVTACLVTKETTYAAAVTKGIITSPPETIPENRQPPMTTPPPPGLMNKLVQPAAEWTCPLCQVTTTCENNLNNHLRGKKHKSMCESLKTLKLNAQVTRPSSSTCGKDGSKQKSCKTPQETVRNKSLKTLKLNAQVTRPSSSTCGKDGSKQKSCKTPQETVRNNQNGTYFCAVCKLLLSDSTIASHLKGKRHSSNVQKMGKS